MNATNNKDKDYIAINLKDTSFSYPPNSKIFCNICSCNLVLLDVQKEEWYCNRCGVSYYPKKEKVKRPNKITVPGPQTDSRGNIIGDRRPIVAMVDDSKATYRRPSKPVIPKSFEFLKRGGVNITSFTSSIDSEDIQ